MSQIFKTLKVQTFDFDCLRTDPLLFNGASFSECSILHPIASNALSDSLTGSLYNSFS